MELIVIVFNKPVWRKIGTGIAIFLLMMLGLAQLFKKDLMRLQSALTFVQSPMVVEHFRHMNRLFDYRPVRSSGPVYRIPYAPKALPASYPYNGHWHALADWIQRTRTTGFIVIHAGNIAFEAYYQGNNARTRCIAWSVGNAFVSALVGVAIQEGLINGLDDLVTDYVSPLKGSGYEGVRLKDAMQMSSGIGFSEDYTDFFSDINRMWRAFARGIPMAHVVASLKSNRPPGSFHRYTGVDAQVLGMVLKEATGRNLATYMEAALWSRLGTEADAYWTVDSTGMELVFCGFNAILRDYARFGLLFLDKGKNFRGQQILPATWIEDSVTPDQLHLLPGPDNPASSTSLGCGYQWWLPPFPDGDYCAIGTYGQFVYIHPRHGVVIAKTSVDTHFDRFGDEMEEESMAVFRFIAEQMARHP